MAEIHRHFTSNAHSAQLNSQVLHAQRPPADPYKRLSDSDLALAFDKNFDAFRPSGTSYATSGKIREVAQRQLTGNPQQDNLTMLARQVVERDHVMNELDTVDHRNNAPRDGRIGRWNPKLAAEKLSKSTPGCPPPHPQPCRPDPCHASPINIYDRMSDSSVALAFGNNYKAFGKPENGVADVEQIYNIAGRQLSGNWAEDNMTLLAREIVKRPHVSHALDSIDDNGRQDGIIGYRNAQLTFAHLARR